MSDLSNRILAIQSHVVSGYVGNKSATFPLQLLGFEVDGINSVQFSNHTGYKSGIRGQVLNDAQLWEIIEGLKANNLDRYSHIINGYIGAPSFLSKVAEVVRTLKKTNPDLIYVCDPVMGDFGPGMYVPESLLPIYCKEIIPIADVCIPNQFEAELITGSKIETDEDAMKAMQKFHEQGVKTVILSSTEYHQNNLVAMASKLGEDGKREVYTIDIPKFDCAFVGTGDLFTALCTAWLQKTNNNLKLTLEMVVCTMQSVLKNTLDHADQIKNSGQDGYQPHEKELKIIQSKRQIESPEPVISAVPLEM